MKILDRYIGEELMWPFLFGVAAFTSIFFAGQNLLKLTSQVLQGMPVLKAVEIVALTLPSVVVYTLPMSALLAVLVGFSRLSSDSEITALYASGVSLYRAIVPVICFGVIISGFGFFFSDYVVPKSNQASRRVQAQVMREQLSTNRPFVFIDKDTDSTIYVRGGLNAKQRTMREVTIVRYRKELPTMVFHAKRAEWQGGDVWKLYNGSAYLLGETGVSSTVDFSEWETQEIKINQTPEQVAMNLMNPEDMSFVQLRRYISELSSSEERLLSMKVSLYNKIAIPFTALIFVLIGAPLAIRPARGGTSVGIGLSILIIFAYWFVWHFSCALANQGSLNPIVGALGPDILGLVLGGLLIIRAAK